MWFTIFRRVPEVIQGGPSYEAGTIVRVTTVEPSSDDLSDGAYDFLVGRYDDDKYPVDPETKTPFEWSPRLGEAEKARLVDRERDRRIAHTFRFNGVAYQLDDRSLERVRAAGTRARLAISAGAQEGDLYWHGADQPFAWIATDNSLTPMDAHTTAAFADAAELWVSRHFLAARAIKNMDSIPEEFAVNEQYWPKATEGR